jgi:hypothetical protein
VVSNKKQTSVDFLFEKLWDTPKDKFEWNAILEKARTRHHLEILSAFVTGELDASDYNDGVNDAEQVYYNASFKQE